MICVGRYLKPFLTLGEAGCSATAWSKKRCEDGMIREGGKAEF
jgi:hypothetical protein